MLINYRSIADQRADELVISVPITVLISYCRSVLLRKMPFCMAFAMI